MGSPHVLDSGPIRSGGKCLISYSPCLHDCPLHGSLTTENGCVGGAHTSSLESACQSKSKVAHTETCPLPWWLPRPPMWCPYNMRHGSLQFEGNKKVTNMVMEYGNGGCLPCTTILKVGLSHLASANWIYCHSLLCKGNMDMRVCVALSGRLYGAL